ncbi:aminopeptidase P family protein [bacterium]|nr:aminopeptidase P family protein [bacterium]
MLNESIYKQRRKALLKHLTGEAMLITAAPERTKSRDLHYPYAQDRNLFYLTGISDAKVALLLNGTGFGPESVLFVATPDPAKVRFDGSRLTLQSAKRTIACDDFKSYESLAQELPQFLTRAEVLNYSIGANPEIDELVIRMFKSEVAPRANFPHTLRDARVLLSEMRFSKDRHEIKFMRKAAAITTQSFKALAAALPSVTSEAHGAALLESYFKKFGADSTAFSTIIASGKNATTLHHTPSQQAFPRNALVLVDAGAEYQGYAADLTRVFPASGRFNSRQAEIYDLVLGAQDACIRAARPGVTLDQLHALCVREITKGLIQLRIIRGPLDKAIKLKRYQKYYMHRTGHFLGLDTHDITPLNFQAKQAPLHGYTRKLPEGAVLTIEPGLYFDASDRDLPSEFRGIGIRIEDDILITKRSAEVLTAAMPKKRSDIESLFR